MPIHLAAVTYQQVQDVNKAKAMKIIDVGEIVGALAKAPADSRQVGSYGRTDFLKFKSVEIGASVPKVSIGQQLRCGGQIRIR
jgi:hypothetical protein